MSAQASLPARIWNAPVTFWLLLALPALPMLAGFAAGDFKHLQHPTGEFAARFMIASMALTPMMMLFPKVRAIRWLVARRRHIGVAAFAYACLHLAAYGLNQGALDKVIADLAKPGLLAGLAAFLVFLPLAVTSNDLALRSLGLNWKPMQRTVYVAAIAVLAHWLLVSKGVGGAAIHFAPLVLLETYRVGRNLKWWNFRFA